MKFIKENFFFICFVMIIYAINYNNTIKQGYSHEEVIGTYIIIGTLMALFAFLSYFYISQINDFFNKFLGDSAAFTLSWSIPLLIFFLIPIFLTQKVLENYSTYLPLFFN